MGKIIFYSTHCPVCMGVEKLLKDKKLEYEECNSIEEIQSLGYDHAPLLSVDGKIYVGAEIYKVLRGM